MAPVQNPKVLVVAFEGDEEGLKFARADKSVYANYYRYVEGLKAHSLVTLQGTIEEIKPDLLHLAVDVNDEGLLVDPEKNQMPLASIVDYAVKQGGSYVIMAKNITQEALGQANSNFPKPFQANLMYTIDRKGRNFNSFLSKLFQRISKGEALGISYVDLNPLDNKEHPNLPDTLLLLGAPKVVLMQDKL